MSLQRIQKSAVLGVVIVVLAAGGLLAGRFSAGAFPHGNHSGLAAGAFGTAP